MFVTIGKRVVSVQLGLCHEPISAVWQITQHAVGIEAVNVQRDDIAIVFSRIVPWSIWRVCHQMPVYSRRETALERIIENVKNIRVGDEIVRGLSYFEKGTFCKLNLVL